MSECSDRNDGAPLVGADTVAFTDDALASGRTLSAVDASSRRDPAEALHRLGRYVVIERLGAGGMGVVYAAYDPELDRKVAIKLLHRDTGDAQAQARLVREAQAMARLSHPHVVPVHDVGTHEGQVFVAMDFVAGETLDAWARRPGHSWQELLEMFVQAGRGLSGAHAAGLVHRDFKAENVLVERGGRALVTDFGLARYDEATLSIEEEAPGAQTLDGDSRELGVRLSTPLTHVGAIVGTPRYMAPEQHRGEVVDARSDQYSFCVALYEALYGEHPFGAAATRLALLAAMQRDEVRPPPRGSKVPTSLYPVIKRGLRAAPEERWPSMDALLAQLQRSPGRTRGRLVAAALGVATVIGGAAALRAERAEPASQACVGVEAAVAEVWSAPRADALRAALGRTGRAYAEFAAGRVVTLFDGYARAWVDAREEACRAHERKLQSDTLYERRVACLERRLEHLSVAVDELVHADEEVAIKAIDIAKAVPPLEPCADAESLMSEASAPADPAVQAALAREAPALARLQAILVAGQFERGLARSGELVERARALGHRPLIAEALVMKAQFHGERAEYAEAEDEAFAGWVEALASERDDLAIEAALELVWVIGEARARTEEGDRWARSAAALLDREDYGVALKTDYALKVGALRMRQGDVEGAAAEYRRAVELQESIAGQPDSDPVPGLANLAITLSVQGRFDEATAIYEDAAARIAVERGETHPDRAVPLNNLAAIHELRGESAKAEAPYREATRILVAVHGEEHPTVITMRGNLARVMVSLGRLDEAEALYRRGVAALQAEGEALPEYIDQIIGLAGVMIERGDFTGALALAREALAAREAARVRPEKIAEAKFILAQALWGADEERPRALELARAAAAELTEVGEGYALAVDEIQRWVDERAPAGKRERVEP